MFANNKLQFDKLAMFRNFDIVFKFRFLNVTKNVLLRVYFAHEYVFGLKITSGSIRVYLNIFDAATKYVHSDEILFCRQIRPAEMEVSGVF